MDPLFDSVTLEGLRRRRTAKWSDYGDDVLAAWVAEMDFRVAEPVREALSEAVERDEFGYAPLRAVTELPAACARYLGEAYGWDVGPERIVVLPDVLHGMATAIRSFSAEGSAVVLPTPSYPPFFDVVGLERRALVEAPMVPAGGRLTFDIDRIGASLAAGAGTVILCNPHNPLGRVFTAAELGALADLVERHGARVIADEVHAPLAYRGNRHIPYATVSEAAAAHSVTLLSASKGWNLPGLKCAQMVLTNDDDLARWRGLSLVATGLASPLGIAANVAAYERGGDWRRRLVDYLDDNRRRLADLLTAEIPELGFRAPEATYLAWVDCRALGVERPSEFFLDRARVAVNAGAAFGAGAEGFVRLNFGTSRAILEQIVAAMADAVQRR
ncbi:MAG: MalY/PatB family protein [Acidimicrobiia bacterium]